MKRLQAGLVVTCGALVGIGCGCAPEMEGSAVSGLTQRDALEGASDPEVVEGDPEATGGIAGQGAEEPPIRSTDGAVIGLEDSDLAGTVNLAPGSELSGQIDLYCCNDGSYTVYVYEGGLCGDPDSWLVENSARVAQLSCSNDVGSAPYVRDPSDFATAAFVVYDASGKALGCADVEAE